MTKMRDAFIGFDTSNYTTSVGLVSCEGEIVANLKRPLPVKAGERGLRQSDAVFAHVKNFPSLFEELQPYLADYAVKAVGVSSKPRNVNGSYMPCFLVGEDVAIAFSSSSSLPLYRFSHQCGHLMAALRSSGKEKDFFRRRFGAFHVSGGTTELLSVAECDNGFLTECVGGTADLHAGQVIDRIGVAMGLPFPAGPSMEELALQNKDPVPHKKIVLKDRYVNLSGLENMAIKLYHDTNNPALTAAFVLDYIADALLSLADAYVADFGDTPFLFGGGVMTNGIVREKIAKKRNAAFAGPGLSADNAVGIAYLTAKAYQK